MFKRKTIAYMRMVRWTIKRLPRLMKALAKATEKFNKKIVRALPALKHFNSVLRSNPLRS